MEQNHCHRWKSDRKFSLSKQSTQGLGSKLESDWANSKGSTNTFWQSHQAHGYRRRWQSLGLHVHRKQNSYSSRPKPKSNWSSWDGTDVRRHNRKPDDDWFPLFRELRCWQSWLGGRRSFDGESWFDGVHQHARSGEEWSTGLTFVNWHTWWKR